MLKQKMLDLPSFLESVLDSDPECIALVDSEARLIWLNRAYENYLGVTLPDVLGKPVTEVIPNTRLHIVVQTGMAELGEVQQIQGRHAIVNRIPIYGDGKVIGAVGKVIFKTSNEFAQLVAKISYLEKEISYYKRELSEKFCARWDFQDIISCSPRMEKVKGFARKVAGIDVSVMILGESGVGKELFAHAIHRYSQRRSMPFVYINCAAIPENLLESELFGYESGAFTSANRQGKSGKLEIANRGTVFLDEVGDMPPVMQAKLLRFLQEGELEKVGAVKPLKVDARVISATNRDIRALVEQGAFRADLFYRLSGVTLEIPPLRERPEDVAALSDYFLKRIAEKWTSPVKRLEGKALEAMQRYLWPGNVRELQHMLERLCCLAEGHDIQIYDLPSYLFNSASGYSPPGQGRGQAAAGEGGNASLKGIRGEAERELLAKTLREAGGNKQLAASRLGIHRTTLYYKLRQHGLLK